MNTATTLVICVVNISFPLSSQAALSTSSPHYKFKQFSYDTNTAHERSSVPCQFVKLSHWITSSLLRSQLGPLCRSWIITSSYGISPGSRCENRMSMRIWSSHVLGGRPEGRLQSGLGWRPSERLMLVISAWWAGTLLGSLAMWANRTARWFLMWDASGWSPVWLVVAWLVMWTNQRLTSICHGTPPETWCRQ